MVLDVFAGTGQVARAAVELGFGSVSVDKDPIQMGFLREFLQQASTKGIPSKAVYDTCNKCDRVIGAAESGLTCSSCGKSVHKECAVEGSTDSQSFCSDICKMGAL